MTEPTVSRMLIRAPGMDTSEMGEQNTHDRQALIEGWNQDVLKNAKIFCIGAGGLGGRALQNLARLGVGHLVFCDFDAINLHNLHTQFFHLNQKFQNKALGLLENLKEECTGTTLLEAYPTDFHTVTKEYPDALKGVVLILCLVDSDMTRHQASRYGLEHGIPVVFAAVSRTTRNGYVFVQNGDACFNCISPIEGDGDQKTPCREPSVIYIHTAIVGIVTYAVVSLLLKWNQDWNYFELFLDSESRVLTREKREDCEICKGVK